jgi:serine/threonine-protein kinase
MLARPAAIKLIKQDVTGGTDQRIETDAEERFEREAQAIASLRSPHTVELFDFGTADNGAFYFAMELLDGLDADTLVRRFGPVPAERAIHLLSQVCHSLSEAHSRGLVHRDVKPANVFVCRYGEELDFVKVLDFGIVKESEREAGDPGLTQADAIQGTPAFVAPEQALGTMDLDGRCDIYATGCLAYWLLTAQHVFTADTPVALLVHHVQTAPAPPSTRTELTIPAALDEIILACLAKDPAERPQTARELAHRLSTVELKAEWTEERARGWWALHQASEVSCPETPRAFPA